MASIRACRSRADSAGSKILSGSARSARRHARIQAAQRILEDDLQVAATPRISAAPHAHEIPTAPEHLAARRESSAADRSRQRGLSGSGFADQPQGLPASRSKFTSCEDVMSAVIHRQVPRPGARGSFMSLRGSDRRPALPRSPAAAAVARGSVRRHNGQRGANSHPSRGEPHRAAGREGWACGQAAGRTDLGMQRSSSAV
jgi:hypothetical protein